MSNLGWYVGSVGVIIALGYVAYLKWRVSRLEKQVADLVALKQAVVDRDQKVAELTTQIQEQHVAERVKGAAEGSKITDRDAAIGFLRDSFRGR